MKILFDKNDDDECGCLRVFFSFFFFSFFWTLIVEDPDFLLFLAALSCLCPRCSKSLSVVNM